MKPTDTQLAMIRETFDALSADPAVSSQFFYEQLFRLDPTLRPLFREDIGDQGMRFMSTLSVIVDTLDKPEEIEDRYADLGRGHRALGVKTSGFATMEEALIETLGHFLGDAFTPPVEDAWRCAMRDISSEIIARGEIPPG